MSVDAGHCSFLEFSQFMGINSLPIHTLFLCGMPGSGKTTMLARMKALAVVEQEASKKKINFIDLDQDILLYAREKKLSNALDLAGLIHQIGMGEMRKLETERLSYWSNLHLSSKQINFQQVIALGGGAVQQNNLPFLKGDRRLLLWINTPLKICWQHLIKDEELDTTHLTLMGKKRPGLMGKNFQQFEELFAERLPYYQQADVLVDVLREELERKIILNQKNLSVEEFLLELF